MKGCILFFILLINTVVNAQEISKVNMDGDNEKKNYNFVGITLENDSIVLGEEVLLLSFGYFACRPCMLEIPLLNRLNEKYSGDIKIVGIFPHAESDIRIYQENIDTTSIFCRIRKHAGFEKINYQIVPECKTKKDNRKNIIAPECDLISRRFDIENYPTNLLIDKNGVIRHVYSGFAAYEADSVIKKIEADIDIILRE